MLLVNCKFMKHCTQNSQKNVWEELKSLFLSAGVLCWSDDQYWSEMNLMESFNKTLLSEPRPLMEELLFLTPTGSSFHSHNPKLSSPNSWWILSWNWEDHVVWAQPGLGVVFLPALLLEWRFGRVSQVLPQKDVKLQVLFPDLCSS